MSSPLILLRDSLATTIAALTPALEPTKAFKHLPGRAIGEPSSNSMHRVFWFSALAGGEITDWGHGLCKVTHELGLFITSNGAGMSKVTMLDRRVTDAMQVIRAINKYTSLPSGVIYCRAESYSIEEAETDSALIAISITAITQESD